MSKWELRETKVEENRDLNAEPSRSSKESKMEDKKDIRIVTSTTCEGWVDSIEIHIPKREWAPAHVIKIDPNDVCLLAKALPLYVKRELDQEDGDPNMPIDVDPPVYLFRVDDWRLDISQHCHECGRKITNDELVRGWDEGYCPECSDNP